MDSATAQECRFLTRLPPEIRMHIYEHVLRFQKPLSLVPATSATDVSDLPRTATTSLANDTAILRTSRQIFAETLPVLYKLNTMTLSRRYFCWFTNTPQMLSFKPRVQRLIVGDLEASYLCFEAALVAHRVKFHGVVYLDPPLHYCPVCSHYVKPLLSALAALPKLEKVLVDIGTSMSWRRFGLYIRYHNMSFRRPPGLITVDPEIHCVDVGRFAVQQLPHRPKLNITFSFVALQKCWDAFSAELTKGPSPQALDSIRADLVNEGDLCAGFTKRLYPLFLAKAVGNQTLDDADLRVSLTWSAVEAARAAGEDASWQLFRLTDALQWHCSQLDLRRQAHRVVASSAYSDFLGDFDDSTIVIL